jgi:hypothetical protein
VIMLNPEEVQLVSGSLYKNKGASTRYFRPFVCCWKRDLACCPLSFPGKTCIRHIWPGDGHLSIGR